LIAKDLAR